MQGSVRTLCIRAPFAPLACVRADAFKSESDLCRLTSCEEPKDWDAALFSDDMVKSEQGARKDLA